MDFKDFNAKNVVERPDLFGCGRLRKVSYFERLVVDRFDDDKVVPVDLGVRDALALLLLFLAPPLRLLVALPLSPTVYLSRNEIRSNLVKIDQPQ